MVDRATVVCAASAAWIAAIVARAALIGSVTARLAAALGIGGRTTAQALAAGVRQIGAHLIAAATVGRICVQVETFVVATAGAGRAGAAGGAAGLVGVAGDAGLVLGQMTGLAFEIAVAIHADGQPIVGRQAGGAARAAGVGRSIV